MGILDALTNLSPEQNQGLLAAAAAMLQAGGPNRRPVSFGQALGGGLQAFQQSMDDSEQRRYLREQQARQSRLLGLRLQEEEEQSADRQRARQLDAGIRDAALASYQSPVQAALGAGGGPTQANAAALAASPNGSFDEQGFLSRVSALDPMRAMELQRALAKQGPEFDTKVQVAIGEDGKPYQYLVSKSGTTRRIEGLPRDEMKLANLGGRDVAYNPFALQAGQSFVRTATPDALLSAATARRGQDMTFQTAGLDRAQRAQADKAPTEFQGKSAAFGLRAQEADKVLNELQGKYEPAAINSKLTVQEWPIIGGLVGAATNKWALTPSDQQAEQAQRDFGNAILRQESGAAIGAQEFDNLRKQYFPQPGDSQAVITQKARNRQLAIQGLNTNAGKARMTAPAAGGWSIQRVGE
jgi:hypothetical protein